jgi:hypothetical protein
MNDFRGVCPEQLAQWFEFPPIVFQGKQDFFDKIIVDGGEGCVLKNLNSTYLEGQRRRSTWVKVKRQVSFDAFVSGFGPGRARHKGQVGYLCFSVNTENGPWEIARVPSLSKTFRKRITVRDEAGLVALHPNMYGKTALVSGQEIARKSLRLSHPRIIRWYRLGVENPCSYRMADIKG